ncbi:EamA family transporter, partial [Saccharothrix coeruleofusca]
AATVGAVQPLVVAWLAVGLLGQRLTARVALAAVAGVAGVSLLVLRADAALDWLGVAAALGGAVVMALGTVLGKRWPAPAPLLATTGWQLVVGGVLLLPVTLAVEGLPTGVTAENAAGYAYLGLVGAALAYCLWFRGVRLLPATEVAFLGLLSPVVAAVVGWLALDQDLTAAQLAGAAIVLAALVAAQTGGGTSGADHRVRSGGIGRRARAGRSTATRA